MLYNETIPSKCVGNSLTYFDLPISLPNNWKRKLKLSSHLKKKLNLNEDNFWKSPY